MMINYAKQILMYPVKLTLKLIKVFKNPMIFSLTIIHAAQNVETTFFLHHKLCKCKIQKRLQT